MGQQIYNEGRVVGFSAYEIYVRHLLSQDPDAKVPTEKEWLAATIGRGASMILKITSGTSVGVHNYSLPSSSTLCAAGVIVASFFDGEVEMTGCWAKRVISYGGLLNNVYNSSPNSNASGVDPSTTPSSGESIVNNTTLVNKLKNYTNITHGLYIEHGYWEANKSTGVKPYKSFKPSTNGSGVGCIRLYVSRKLTSDVYILLTGFMNKTIVTSLVSEDSNVWSTHNPENGDFLGPEEFPWASKIIFTTPSELTYLMNNESYARKIPETGDDIEVRDTPIIDTAQASFDTYYSTHTSYNDSRPTFKVTKLNTINDGVSVLTIHPVRTKEDEYSYEGTDITNKDLPPALYGGRYTSAGEQYMYPIDTCAPGTVKLFSSEDEYGSALAHNYPLMLPGLYSLYKETIYHDTPTSVDTVGVTDLYLIDKNPKTVNKIRKTKITTDIEHLKLTPLNGNSATSTSPDKYVPVVEISSKDQSAKVLSLTDSDGQWLSLTGTTSIDSQTPVLTNFNNSTGTLVGKGLAWSHLIHALNADRSIKILGKALAIIDENDVIQLSSTDPSRIGGSFTANEEVIAEYDITGSIFDGIVDETHYTKLVATSKASYLETYERRSYRTRGCRLYIGDGEPQPNDADDTIPIGSIWIGGE